MRRLLARILGIYLHYQWVCEECGCYNEIQVLWGDTPPAAYCIQCKRRNF